MEFIDAAYCVMGGIDLDPASSLIANQIIKANKYFTAENNGLVHPWKGRVWMNPPYSGDLVGKFADKLVKHLQDGDISEAIVLVNNATETIWFQTLLSEASSVCFPKGRIRFIDTNGDQSNAPLQGQAILYFGKNIIRFNSEFEIFGKTLNG